jgi:hypothetical protein
MAPLRPDYWEIEGDRCRVELQRRPPHCDRGNFIARVALWEDRLDLLDAADLWPRYYFDFEAAKAEVIAFLVRRRKFVPGKSAWREMYLPREGSPHAPA